MLLEARRRYSFWRRSAFSSCYLESSILILKEPICSLLKARRLSCFFLIDCLFYALLDYFLSFRLDFDDCMYFIKIKLYQCKIYACNKMIFITSNVHLIFLKEEFKKMMKKIALMWVNKKKWLLERLQKESLERRECSEIESWFNRCRICTCLRFRVMRIFYRAFFLFWSCWFYFCQEILSS